MIDIGYRQATGRAQKLPFITRRPLQVSLVGETIDCREKLANDWQPHIFGKYNDSVCAALQEPPMVTLGPLVILQFDHVFALLPGLKVMHLGEVSLRRYSGDHSPARRSPFAGPECDRMISCCGTTGPSCSIVAFSRNGAYYARLAVERFQERGYIKPARALPTNLRARVLVSKEVRHSGL